MFLALRHRTAEPANISLVISANTNNWNVIAKIGYTPAVPVVVNLTINAGIVVNDTVLGAPTQAIDFSGLLSGSTINFTNLGYVLGQGGDGGGGGNYFVPLIGSNGSAGGTAIKGPGAGRTLNITNASGNIWGGGGGAGGGGGRSGSGSAGGGGGGGGVNGGFGAAGGDGLAGTTDGFPGTSGTIGIAGVIGTGGDSGGPGAGNGGNGGNWGLAGATGASGLGGAGGFAGAAGKAINLNGGSANFISGSGAPNVKGAVA